MIIIIETGEIPLNRITIQEEHGLLTTVGAISNHLAMLIEKADSAVHLKTTTDQTTPTHRPIPLQEEVDVLVEVAAEEEVTLEEVLVVDPEADSHLT